MPAVPEHPLLCPLSPLSPLLQHLAGSQLSATLLAVAGSLATALFSFVALPVLDWLLGRDLRAPSEVRKPTQMSRQLGASQRWLPLAALLDEMCRVGCANASRYASQAGWTAVEQGG